MGGSGLARGSRAAVVACLACGVAVGCGDDAGDEPPARAETAAPGAAAPRPVVVAPSGDRRAVQERTAAYVGAYSTGDGAGACALYTDELRERSDRRARSQGYEDCADALTQIGGQASEAVPRDLLALLRDPNQVRVGRLEGDRAEASYEFPGQAVALQRVDGTWRIAQVGVDP